MMYKYEKQAGDVPVNRFIMLKHKESGKYLYVENSELIVKVSYCCINPERYNNNVLKQHKQSLIKTTKSILLALSPRALYMPSTLIVVIYM